MLVIDNGARLYGSISGGETYRSSTICGQSVRQILASPTVVRDRLNLMPLVTIVTSAGLYRR